MKRSRHEILSKILKICLNGASKTRIVYQANLNFRTVNPYLQTLIKNNLIETCQGEQREHLMYRTTSEGANLQETMTQVNSILLHG
jgi:predicted transcriptional regulator